MEKIEKIVVTRHKGLVEFLRENLLIDDNDVIVAHADQETVRGKHVIGVLPLTLAACAAKVTEIPLNLPAEMRGKELSVEEVRRFSSPPKTYRVEIIEE